MAKLKLIENRAPSSAPRLPRGGAARFLPLLFVFLLHGTAGAAPALTARLDRDSASVGETVTLTLSFEGAAPRGAPVLPPLPGMQVAGQTQSSEFNLAGGQTTSRISYQYQLNLTQPGDFTIPAMQVNVNGAFLATQPLKLKVSPAAALPPGAGQPAFLQFAPPPKSVYFGEPFPVELRLYVQSARELQMPQIKTEGFTVSKPGEPTQTRTTVGNVAYTLIVFRMAATPVKTGRLPLGPAETSLMLVFQTDFFGNPVRAQRTTLRSETNFVEVLPLPAEGRPPTFNGAIGTFSLSVTAGPTNLAVGDPITIKAQIAGTGPIETLRLAEQAQWSEFKSYAPDVTVKTSDPLGLAGVKTFEQVVIPQNHEIKFLPPLQFSFFDPKAKAYRTLTGPAFALNIRPSAASAPPPSLANGASGENKAPPVDDIERIKVQFASAAGAGVPLLRQSWFVALQAVPFAVWMALLLARKRNEALANNPKLRRQRAVAQKVREGLLELRQLAAAQKSDEFFATLFRLLQEQLGERLDLPAAAITEAVLDERLGGRKLSPQALTGLHSLFQSCNQARYAPVQSVQELESFLPRVEKAMEELRTFKG